MPAGIVVQHLTGPPDNIVASPLGRNNRFRTDESDALNTNSPVVLPSLFATTLIDAVAPVLTQEYTEITVNDGVIAENSNVLTSATAGFQSGDVGDSITISGQDLELASHITVYTNGTTVQLGGTPSVSYTSMSPATVVFYRPAGMGVIAQSVAVISSVGLNVDDYLIVEPGTPLQEVVQVTAITDGTHLTALFGRSHRAGAALIRISAARSKALQIQVKEAPLNSVARFAFRRTGKLPPGVFDQWRTLMTYVQGATAAWPSDSTHVFDPVPTADTVFAPSPVSTVSSVLPMVEIQWLFTGIVEDIPLTEYVFTWQES